MSTWNWRTIDDDGLDLGEFVRIVNTRMGRLVEALTQVIGLTFGAGAATDRATAPSVARTAILTLAYTAPATITTFRDGVAGQTVRVWATTANATIQHSTAAGGIRMKGGATVTLTATETRAFATVDGLSWREV